MNTINNSNTLTLPINAENVIFLNQKARAWHAKFQVVKAAVDRPLWEVFCSALLLESACIMTEEAKLIVQERAHSLGLDFYAQKLHADEVTVRLSGLPMTSEDVHYLLDL